eukprot:GHVT01005115.1.p1 GENE.GHVT01005115.1~~GHVT01005115.1.p1  ORF type:complete len:485 (-),score=116.79 GHVT01005115.1:655-2109(-)
MSTLFSALGGTNANFLRDALAVGQRCDGRRLDEQRKISIDFPGDYGQVCVSIGASRVQVVVVGELVAPCEARPSEGFLSFSVDLAVISETSFGADATAAGGRAARQAVAAEIHQLIDGLLRGTRAIDTEALCVKGGAKVWSIEVFIRPFNDDGNLRDASALAALVALKHFKRQEVTVVGNDDVVLHSTEEREPIPLSLHHVPILFSFGLWDDGSGKASFLLDPSRQEEALLEGNLSVSVNQLGELCGLFKPGGIQVDENFISDAVKIAGERAAEVAAFVIASLERDRLARLEARRNIHRAYSFGAPLRIAAPPKSTAPRTSRSLFKISPFSSTPSYSSSSASASSSSASGACQAAGDQPASHQPKERRRTRDETPSLSPRAFTPTPILNPSKNIDRLGNSSPSREGAVAPLKSSHATVSSVFAAVAAETTTAAALAVVSTPAAPPSSADVCVISDDDDGDMVCAVKARDPADIKAKKRKKKRPL